MKYLSGTSRENSTDANTFLGADKEWLVQFCEETIRSQEIDFFVFGLSLFPGFDPPPHLIASHCINIHTANISAKCFDEDGIRTHAGRAQWISSPSP